MARNAKRGLQETSALQGQREKAGSEGERACERVCTEHASVWHSPLPWQLGNSVLLQQQQDAIGILRWKAPALKVSEPPSVQRMSNGNSCNRAT